MPTETERTRLRRAVGDRIPVGGDDTMTFFTTPDIDDLWTQADGNLNAAAFQGWLDKCAELARLIDTDISGAARRFSKLFDQAQAMLRHYGTLIGADVEAIVGRIVGRAINLRESATPPLVMPVSSGFRSEAVNGRAKQILANSHPDTMEEDPSYPAPGPVATS